VTQQKQSNWWRR